MKLKKEVIMSKGLKISLLEKEKVIGRGYLYIMKNELHKQPSLIGYLEDIYVG